MYFLEAESGKLLELFESMKVENEKNQQQKKKILNFWGNLDLSF